MQNTITIKNCFQVTDLDVTRLWKLRSSTTKKAHFFFYLIPSPFNLYFSLHLGEYSGLVLSNLIRLQDFI